MGVFTTINGVTYQLHGTLSQTAAPLSVELTPTLSANTQNGYIASATSEYSESTGTASAYKAFNKVTGSGWINGWSSSAQATASAPQRLTLEFPSAITTASYSVKIRDDANTLAPTAWALEGWDGTAWVSLHSVSALTWAKGETKTFTVPTPASYIKYRLSCTASGTYCQIDEWKMYS